MYGILNDGIRVATVTFSERNLARLQTKYGDAFRPLGGQMPLQPAAAGTATVEPLWKKEPAKAAPKPEKPKKEPTANRKLASAEKKTGGGHNAKPVISMTTGEYYRSSGQAARAIGAHDSDICTQIKGTLRKGKYRLHTVKGQTFRLATPEEIKAKRMLPTP